MISRIRLNLLRRSPGGTAAVVILAGWAMVSACQMFSPTPASSTVPQPLIVTAAPTFEAPTLPPPPSPTSVGSAEPAPTATLLPLPPLPTEALVTLAPLPATLAPLPPTVQPPAATATHPATLRLKVFLIAIGDNGVSGPMVGCGDSAIPVIIDVPYTQGVLRAALENLLARKEQFFGQSGLYNALYQSNLRLEDVSIQNGVAVIELSGQALLGGECDTPRVIAQLEQTALQFNTVQKVTILLNGRPIRDALSSRG